MEETEVSEPIETRGEVVDQLGVIVVVVVVLAGLVLIIASWFP